MGSRGTVSKEPTDNKVDTANKAMDKWVKEDTVSREDTVRWASREAMASRDTDKWVNRAMASRGMGRWASKDTGSREDTASRGSRVTAKWEVTTKAIGVDPSHFDYYPRIISHHLVSFLPAPHYAKLIEGRLEFAKVEVLLDVGEFVDTGVVCDPS